MRLPHEDNPGTMFPGTVGPRTVNPGIVGPGTVNPGTVALGTIDPFIVDKECFNINKIRNSQICHLFQLPITNHQFLITLIIIIYIS